MSASFSNHTVTLNVPLHEAFTILAISSGHERVCRLSKLCTGFELLQRDTVFGGPRGLDDGTRFCTMDPGTACLQPKVKALMKGKFGIDNTLK